MGKHTMIGYLLFAGAAYGAYRWMDSEFTKHTIHISSNKHDIEPIAEYGDSVAHRNIRQRDIAAVHQIDHPGDPKAWLVTTKTGTQTMMYSDPFTVLSR